MTRGGECMKEGQPHVHFLFPLITRSEIVADCLMSLKSNFTWLLSSVTNPWRAIVSRDVALLYCATVRLLMLLWMIDAPHLPGLT